MSFRMQPYRYPMLAVHKDWRIRISASAKINGLRSFGFRFPGAIARAASDGLWRGSLRTPKLPVVLGFVVATLLGCSNNDSPIKTTAGYPPVTLKPSGLPTYAVGDRFTFNNPDETWTVIGIRDGLVKWRSSLKAEKVTVFDPVLPPVSWNEESGASGSQRLLEWDKTLFPLKRGQKISFKTRVRRKGTASPETFIWKCYSGGPRKLDVEVGEFPAYPVFCRRSDGLTRQSFYAPDVNGPLIITTRKRPAPAITRELVSFARGAGPRIAAIKPGNLPKGWAIAAVDAAQADAARPRVVRIPTAGAAGAVSKSAGAPNPSERPPRVASASSTSPVIPPPPIIPAPKSTGAQLSAKNETLDAVAIRPPRSPVASKPKAGGAAGRSTLPSARRSTSRSKAVAGAKAQGDKTAAPTPPSIAPPASVFGRRTAPPPPVIAPPTQTSYLDKARSQDRVRSRTKRPAPPANVSTSSTDRTTRGQKRLARRPPGPVFGVQLGSFRKPELAKDDWKRLKRRLGPLLKNWGHVVKHVNLGPSKGIFYRLMAGPTTSRTNAAALCAALKARGAACLVRTLRN